MSCDRRPDKVPSVQSLKDSLPTGVVPRIGGGPSAILEKWGEFLIQVTQTNRGERGVCAAYRTLPRFTSRLPSWHPAGAAAGGGDCGASCGGVDEPVLHPEPLVDWHVVCI